MGTPGPRPQCPSVNQPSGKTVALLSGRASLPLGGSGVHTHQPGAFLPPASASKRSFLSRAPTQRCVILNFLCANVMCVCVCVLDFQGKSLNTLKLHQNSHLSDLSRPGEIAPNGAPRQLMSCLRAQLVRDNERKCEKTQQNTRSKMLLAEKPTSPFPQPLCSQCSFSSVAQSCPTLSDPMNRSTPGLPVHHQLPEFPQTRVHRVSDAIQPYHPLLSPSPPAPNHSQHQNLFQ